MQQPWNAISRLLLPAGGGTAIGMAGAPWWAVGLIVAIGLAGTLAVQIMTLLLPQDSADRTQLLLAWLQRRRRCSKGF